MKEFEPTMQTLKRIMNTIIVKGSRNKTDLSLYSNINYTRLTKHLVWLENKGFVKSTIKDSRISINMTDSGRLFTLKVLVV